MQKLKYQPPIFPSDNEFGKWLRAGLRQSGITFEETLQTQVAVTTPNQPVGMLPRRIGNREAEFFPAGKVLRLRHRQEQLGRSQLIFVHERQPLFDQARRVPPGPLDDADIHRPQVRRHQQAANEHHQTEGDTGQEP